MNIQETIQKYVTSEAEVKEILIGLGGSLRKYRKECKVSTVDFEKASLIPRHRLKKIEEGKTNYTIKTLIECYKIIEQEKKSS